MSALLHTPTDPQFITNPVSARQVIESAAEFTDSFEMEAIRNSFIATLRELMPRHDVALLKVSANTNALSSYRILNMEVADESEHDSFFQQLEVSASWMNEHTLDAVRKNGHTLIQNAAKQLLLSPIVVKDKITNLVVLRGTHITQEDTHLANGFARLYSNFVSLKIEGDLDPLTGLLNRRTLDLNLAKVIREANELSEKQSLRFYAIPGPHRDLRAQTDDKQIYLAVVDIDNFKSINDNFGHLFGDEVIVTSAQLLTQSFREEDSIFRYGGEEFVVVFATHGREEAQLLLERFRQRVESHKFSQLDKVTVSTGFCMVKDLAVPASVVSLADQALYHAKTNGKNQVVYYHDMVQTGAIKPSTESSEVEFF